MFKILRFKDIKIMRFLIRFILIIIGYNVCFSCWREEVRRIRRRNIWSVRFWNRIRLCRFLLEVSLNVNVY